LSVKLIISVCVRWSVCPPERENAFIAAIDPSAVDQLRHTLRTLVEN